MTTINSGSIVKSSRFPEPVHVNLIEEIARDMYQLVGYTINTRQHIEVVLSKSDIEQLQVLNTDNSVLSDAMSWFLAFETKRYRNASLFDPLLAMNTSKVDPLPHQIEAVYGYILRQPCIRFMIADDPGAGKTIMAGLIIKELKLRNLVERVLIVAPGHLRDQWKREMKERFEEHFVTIDRAHIDSFYAENVWTRENMVVTSLDFAKQDDIRSSLGASNFDLVIVDEAHKLSAYKYGDKVNKTTRYNLGEVLSNISEHLLLLTATPHRGDPENFRLLLDLMSPGFYATVEKLSESITKGENQFFIRRVKEDLKTMDGKPLFLPRTVETVGFEISRDSEDERSLYNSLSEYVEKQYNKALSSERTRNIAFALVMLQRRFASSMYALQRSLERRRDRLSEMLRNGNSANMAAASYETAEEQVEDMDEQARWEREQAWETVSVAINAEELQKEIGILESLIARTQQIIQNESELKLAKLRDELNIMREKFPDKKDKRVLIFTESRDTLEYLTRKLRDWGYSVNNIHGGMKLEDRVREEAVFRNETDILVATEAAGEGINLQFCHLMINYDIPWNPNRLEQRMGRIHRYGQTKEVFIYNFVSVDTREGQVLSTLLRKLDEIRDAMGSDRVFDVINTVMSGRDFTQMLVDAAANARNIKDILREIDIQVDEAYVKQLKDQLGESLATHYIDYTRIKSIQDKAREMRLIPEYTEHYFLQAFGKAGGKHKQRADGNYSIESIPADIRRIARKDTFRKRFGELLSRYATISFDKNIALADANVEFVSFGHPLFEAVMQWVEESFKTVLLSGAVLQDPDNRLNGYLLVYEGEIMDGNAHIAGKRLFVFYTNGTSPAEILHPAVLWDLIKTQSAAQTEEDKAMGLPDTREIGKKYIPVALEKLSDYKDQLEVERTKQAEIKRKYGVSSLNYMIDKLDGDIIALEQEREKGKNVDLPVRNKEETKARYERNVEVLQEQIQREISLTCAMPRLTGVARIVPLEKAAALPSAQTARSTKEIEMVGMRVVADYESKAGRTPEDVSSDNLGFDIRSLGTEEIRYIEVKARAGIGDVELTQNEWFAAKRFRDEYYLYVVLNAATIPELRIIRNPYESLRTEPKFDVRYTVSSEQVVGFSAESAEESTPASQAQSTLVRQADKRNLLFPDDDPKQPTL